MNYVNFLISDLSHIKVQYNRFNVNNLKGILYLYRFSGYMQLKIR